MGIDETWDCQLAFAVNDFDIFDVIRQNISIDNPANECNLVIFNDDIGVLYVAVVPQYRSILDYHLGIDTLIHDITSFVVVSY